MIVAFEFGSSLRLLGSRAYLYENLNLEALADGWYNLLCLRANRGTIAAGNFHFTDDSFFLHLPANPVPFSKPMVPPVQQSLTDVSRV